MATSTGGISRSLPRGAATARTTIPRDGAATGGGDGGDAKVRSLADLVRCAAGLSAEANGAADGERGNVVSHKPVRSERGGEEDAKMTTEEESLMSTLHISDEGTPYLRAASSSGPAEEVVDDANDDANENSNENVIAVGVMGEDGQRVRFCEYDNKTSETVNNSNSPCKDRMEQRMDMEYDDQSDTDEEEEEGGNGRNSDDSSGGSNQDEEILAELGLSELFLPEDDEDDEIIMMNMERTSTFDQRQQTNNQTNRSEENEMRSFRVLWELLMRWTTPSTVELVLRYQGRCTKQPPPGQQNESSSPSAVFGSKELPPEKEEEKSQSVAATDSYSERNTVDVGSSRRASIMSMLKMYISRSLSELKKMRDKPKINRHDGMVIIDEVFGQRKVEQSLADLVGTFDPSAPAANLNTKMWKGLTTILIAISFPSLDGRRDASDTNDGDDAMPRLPPSVQILKMSPEEYRYLTRSAIVSLSDEMENSNC